MGELVLCGVDEAGRGPLAGPVFAAAVILDPHRPIAGLDDSKRLRPATRERLFARIVREARAWAIARAEVAEIDRFNIRAASLLAMRRAVDLLPLLPTRVLVDGDSLPAWSYPSEAIVGGDGRVAEIAAASILAKVARDRLLVHFDRLYPGYGFAAHKGYPSPSHLAALAQLGPCPEHRRSFAPVARLAP